MGQPAEESSRRTSRPGSVVGVDVGGTKVAAVAVGPAGQVLNQVTVPSPADDASQLCAAIVDAARQAAGGAISTVGVAAAGYISADRSTVLFSPNISWLNEPLQEKLQAELGVPVSIENDANAAAWAEYCTGAGQNVADMAMLTMGTGVGCGLVLNGSLYRGGHGIAAEFGHTVMVPDGIPCGCGQKGCTEQYISGRALDRMAVAALDAADPSEAAALVAYAEAGAVTGKAVTQAAAVGDPLAQSVLGRFGDLVGRAIADLTAMLDPKIVVLGGGVVAGGQTLLAASRDAYAQYVTGGAKRPVAQIELAQTGPWAGAVGAALLAQT